MRTRARTRSTGASSTPRRSRRRFRASTTSSRQLQAAGRAAAASTRTRRAPADAPDDRGAADLECDSRAAGDRRAQDAAEDDAERDPRVRPRPRARASVSPSCARRSTRAFGAPRRSASASGGLPLLARVPAPPKRFARKDRLAMVESRTARTRRRSGCCARTSSSPRLGREIRSVMITSAVEQEGKSTTIANLAVALARAGQARRARRPRPAPPVPRPFLRSRPAGTHAGRARPCDARRGARPDRARRVMSPQSTTPASSKHGGNGRGQSRVEGMLHVCRRDRFRRTPASSSATRALADDPRAAAEGRRHRPDRLAARAALR